MSTTFRLQRTLLAACIILAPLSITLYILAWPENPAPVVVNTTTPAPIVTRQPASSARSASPPATSSSPT